MMENKRRNTRKRMMKKYVFVIFSIISILLLVSCGKEETIDGKWVLVKEEFDDGTVIKGNDLSIYESYEINGANGVFTSITDQIGTKSFDVIVEEVGENEYQFKISDRLVFSTGTLEGKQLVFELSDGTLFYYEKE